MIDEAEYVELNNVKRNTCSVSCSCRKDSNAVSCEESPNLLINVIDQLCSIYQILDYHDLSQSSLFNLDSADIALLLRLLIEIEVRAFAATRALRRRRPFYKRWFTCLFK